MRVVRSGKSKSKKSKVKRVIDCQKCGCEFVVGSKDLDNFKFVGDWRDGSYYEIPCPECKHKNNVASSLF